MDQELVERNVKEYYSIHLGKTKDLKTNACCTMEKYPENIKKLLKNVNEEIKNTYYGCGLVIPDKLKNCNILDLGCGTGLDVYLLSQLVGENGQIIGVDMTDKQLNIANNWLDWHMKKFNYDKSNVIFKKGYIELLDKIDIKSNSMDIIISNCVVNLSYDKRKVLEHAYRILKTGGEFYFSDVYSNKRIPENLRTDKVLWGECLSGALYWNDFINLSKECGFKDVRLVKYNKITINNDDIKEKLGNIEFYSATYRLFKLDLEYDCEDYGQSVIYKGTINNNNNYWDLDNHHRFHKGKNMLVCGNTWKMLYDSRFKDDFEFIGNFDNHFGIFDGCGKKCPFTSNSNSNSICNSNTNCC